MAMRNVVFESNEKFGKSNNVHVWVTEYVIVMVTLKTHLSMVRLELAGSGNMHLSSPYVSACD